MFIGAAVCHSHGVTVNTWWIPRRSGITTPMQTLRVDDALAPWGELIWPRPARSVTVDERVAREMLASFQPQIGPDARLATISKGSNAQSWAVEPRSGRRLVLRCALGNDARGALEAMAAAAVAVAAAGLNTKTPLPGPDGSYAVLDGDERPWQCWTWLDGRHPSGSIAEARELGATLRRFHEILDEWLCHGRPAHEPYWPERFDRGDVVAALARLRPSPAGRPASTVALAAYELTGEVDRLGSTAGHGDCHTDNWVILPGGAGVALFDLELIGARPGAQLTDLGVLIHRMARLAVQSASPSSERGLERASAVALALARSYDGESKTVAPALGCAIRESLAKLIGCALHGPPGLDLRARHAIAANHCVYLCELVALTGELESPAG